MEEELRDVVMEVGLQWPYAGQVANEHKANALSPNWGQTIFQSANEIAANSLLRKGLDEIQAQAEVEKAWWDKRRESISGEFMKELDAKS